MTRKKKKEDKQHNEIVTHSYIGYCIFKRKLYLHINFNIDKNMKKARQ